MTNELPPTKYTLVFNWVNTLIKTTPQPNVPFTKQLDLREVDGVIETLEILHHRQYTMVVGANAIELDAVKVWESLSRVGLNEYFKAVFTASETGRKTPGLSFFRQIESVLSQSPGNLVMIGDSYQEDVLSAKAAGWKAIWYNPDKQTAPGAAPLHDGEIAHMALLPASLERLNLPDYQTCLSWLEERDIPFNILTHVQFVAAVAYLLAVWLSNRGVAIDPVLTHRGGLLHDLGKMDSLRTGQDDNRRDHASLAWSLLSARQQPLLADIADRHMIYMDSNYARRPQTWEEKVVHFADKLVEGNQLVTLQERISALKTRYPTSAKEIQNSLPILLHLEKEICDRLEMPVQALVPRLHTALGLFSPGATVHPAS